MASPVACRFWWLQTSNDSSIKFSYPSPSLHSSSAFFSFQLPPRKRTRVTTYALHDSPPRSSTGKKQHPEAVSTEVGANTASSDPPSDKNELDKKNEVIFHSKTIKTLNSTSLRRKRSVWRRVFFASKKVRSIILLNVITLIYASDIPVIKEVEAIMDPAAFTVMRFAMSAIPFIPFVIRARDDVKTRNAGVELGFWVSLGYLMQALGLLTSDVGRASFISVLTVVVVPLIDGMLGATVPSYTWFGALMSVLGVATLESSGSPPCVGDLLNFLSAVFFGIHMLRTEHFSRSMSRKKFLPILGFEVCIVTLLSTVWYIVGSWLGGNHESDPWTSAMCWNWLVEFPWIPALYTGVFSTGLCLWIEMDAMCNVSATETAIIYALEPVWGAGFAWFLLGERWGAYGWLGAALVLGGSLTVQIYGSLPPNESKDLIAGREKDDLLQISDKNKGLFTSPVAVDSRKDVTDLFKK